MAEEPVDESKLIMSSRDIRAEIREAIWERLHPRLTAFGERARANYPSILVQVGQSHNDAFVLRAWTSLLASGEGQELALTVDVTIGRPMVTLTSELVFEDGEIVMGGPEIAIPVSDFARIEGLLAWLRALDDFLAAMDPVVMRRIRDLFRAP